MFVHINIHFGVGIIVASVFNHLLELNFLEFFLVVVFSFICDFDILFSNYALDSNHRMLISHSILPSIIITVLGVIFNWIILIIGGLSYSLHVIIDTFDWGTNFFYFKKKQVGLKLLITKEEFANISMHLSQYKKPGSFFDKKYYGNKGIILTEVIIFISMIMLISIFAFRYFLLIVIYFIFLGFHLHRHFKLKQIESD